MNLNEKVLSFYNKDRDGAIQKESNYGEVPEVYQKGRFKVCISGYKWVVPTTLRTNKLSAKILLKKMNGAEFEEILSTETVSGVSSPQFTKQARFAPLDMSDSQAYAISSFLRVEVVINSVFYSAIEFSLAQLLWDRLVETPITPYLSTITGKSTPGSGMILVNIVRDRPVEHCLPKHDMKLCIRTCSSLWKRVVESKIRVAISVVAEKGRWGRIYFSEALAKPFGAESKTNFASISLDRDELTAYNPNNPMRLQVYGVRSGNQVLLGFSQFVLAELFSRDALGWFRTEFSYLNTGLKLGKCRMSSASSEVHLILGNPKIWNNPYKMRQDSCSYKDFALASSSASTSARSDRTGSPDHSSSSSGIVTELSGTGKARNTQSHEFVWFPEDGYESYSDEDSDYSDGTPNRDD